MAGTGFPYTEPRLATEARWLTPIPSRKRPGYASASAFEPADIAIASRAQMLAIPVATTASEPAASSSPAWANTSLLPRLSGTHTAP